MMTPADYRSYGEELERLLLLRTSPIAVKMLKTENDIPEGAVRPVRDRHQHLAQCQALALSRRNRETVAMLLEDNWCFAPPIAYGLVDRPDNPEYAFFTDFPRFERGKYVGIVSAPLRATTFAPEIVIVYCNPAQLRNLLQPLHFNRQADDIMYNFFPPVCSSTVVTVMETGKFMVALPDPGEYMRALPAEEEMIFSIPEFRLQALVEGYRQLHERGLGYLNANMEMKTDFEQPPMYRELFRQWGILADD